MTSCDPATIFLTGSSGLVGSSIRRRLADDADFRVVPVERGAIIPSGQSPAVAIHAAWPADPSSWVDFRDWSMRLRATTADRGAWFVALGTGVEAYADHSGLKEPYRSYALRKLELRDMLAEVDRSKSAWLRLHFMFGPGERASRLVPAAIRAAMAGEDLVCGALDRRRRWLHVDDQADYLVRFLSAPQQGDLDIASRFDVSFRDLLNLVGRATGRKLRVKESDGPVPDSALEAIVPERMSAVVPADAGNPDSLLGRLREFAAQLTGASAGELGVS